MIASLRAVVGTGVTLESILEGKLCGPGLLKSSLLTLQGHEYFLRLVDMSIVN